jgi:hypothetical protein
MKFSHKHIGFDSDDFLESAKVISNSAGLISDKVDEFRAIELTPDEKGVFAQSAMMIAYDEPEEAPIQPVQLLQERRYDDRGNNLWNTFNVVQENMTKGGLKGGKRDKNNRWRRTTTREITSIDRDRKLNEALWHLTEAMAELKAA